MPYIAAKATQVTQMCERGSGAEKTRLVGGGGSSDREETRDEYIIGEQNIYWLQVTRGHKMGKEISRGDLTNNFVNFHLCSGLRDNAAT